MKNALITILITSNVALIVFVLQLSSRLSDLDEVLSRHIGEFSQHISDLDKHYLGRVYSPPGLITLQQGKSTAPLLSLRGNTSFAGAYTTMEDSSGDQVILFQWGIHTDGNHNLDTALPWFEMKEGRTSSKLELTTNRGAPYLLAKNSDNSSFQLGFDREGVPYLELSHQPSGARTRLTPQQQTGD